MPSSEIYSDFSKEIHWIKKRIQEDVDTFPESLQYLVEYYLKKRLKILHDKKQRIRFDPELGRPVPYAVFWFADAFGFLNKETTRKLALSLVYSSIVTTIRDDTADSDPLSRYQYSILANTFLHKYFMIFEEFFDPDSRIWYFLSNNIKEMVRYERWNHAFQYKQGVDSFSDDFLEESSRYFSAVVVPTIAALAILSNNEGKIPIVTEFLREFSKGWRIFDDLTDWRKDLEVRKFNHSSILIYVLNRIDRKSVFQISFV